MPICAGFIAPTPLDIRDFSNCFGNFTDVGGTSNLEQATV